MKHKEKLPRQDFSQLLFRLSSADFQINSDSARYYVGALKKKIVISCVFQLQSKAVKQPISCALKFLTSSVDSTTSFHLNSFDSVDEENFDALLSASFELEEKVVSISKSLHMEKSKI